MGRPGGGAAAVRHRKLLFRLPLREKDRGARRRAATTVRAVRKWLGVRRQRSRYAGRIRCLEAIDQMVHAASVVCGVDFAPLKGAIVASVGRRARSACPLVRNVLRIHSSIVRRCFDPSVMVCLRILLS